LHDAFLHVTIYLVLLTFSSSPNFLLLLPVPTSSVQRKEVNNTTSVLGHKVNSTDSVPNENPAVLVGCQHFPSHSIEA
ncbi:hypothetical protein C0J52_24045, partial [Blattella germanica]